MTQFKVASDIVDGIEVAQILYLGEQTSVIVSLLLLNDK